MVSSDRLNEGARPMKSARHFHYLGASCGGPFGERLGAGAGNGLQQNRHLDREDRTEPLHAVRLGRHRPGASRCCGWKDRRAGRPGRHFHGRFPIRAAHGQGAGGDPANQHRADSFHGQSPMCTSTTPAATRTSPRWASQSLRVKSFAKNCCIRRRWPMAIRHRRAIRPRSPSSPMAWARH